MLIISLGNTYTTCQGVHHPNPGHLWHRLPRRLYVLRSENCNYSPCNGSGQPLKISARSALRSAFFELETLGDASVHPGAKSPRLKMVALLREGEQKKGGLQRRGCICENILS